MESSAIQRAGGNSGNQLPPAGSGPRRMRPAGAVCDVGGSYGSPYPYMRDGKVYGCCLPGNLNGATMEEVARALCWTGTTLVQAAVAAGANVVFSIEVKWWFQIQELTNLNSQTARSFELTQIRYGQSNYYMQIEELKINGTTVAQQGIDVRIWNYEIEQRFFPVPACGLNDPVEITFTNVTGAPADFAILTMGPAVLQIG